MILNIEEESRYHSIVVMRTTNQALANTFPYTVFTNQNVINMNFSPDEQPNNFQYNVDIDAFKCTFKGKRLVLADFEKIATVFMQKQTSKARQQVIVSPAMLKNFKQVQFYLYLSSQEFIKVIPSWILSTSILFDIPSSQLTLQKEPFKDLTQTLREDFKQGQDYFIYNSQFGLLSDLHFTNAFIRGYREFSCYKKLGPHYVHVMSPKVENLLNKNVHMAHI